MGSVTGQKIDYLAIIPQAQMGCESIAHEAEGRVGYIESTRRPFGLEE